uniref:Uncharacterized protein n=1 Tax=Avena sativa TaxID=4498 RepID=A0ACD5W8I6_AVESA
MVSWGDGEESSDDMSSLGTEGPNSMYDSDYNGRADDGDNLILCKCNCVVVKHVAFEGCWTGRRFLACAGEEGETCDFIHWVDNVWPESLCKSLTKLWDMYSTCKDGRVNDSLKSFDTRMEYEDEIAKLKLALKNAQDNLKQVVEEKQLTLALKAKAEQALIDARAELERKMKVDASTSNMHKSLRLNAEKQRDMLKEEKRNLEHTIAELMKQKEGARSKLRKIKQICDE